MFVVLHQSILRGGYNLQASDLRQAFDHGRFNCVTASLLLNCLAERFELKAVGLEMPGHAMSRLELPGETLDVETTCPRWFAGIDRRSRADSPQAAAASAAEEETAAPAELAAKSLARQAAPGHPLAAGGRRQVSDVELVATIYYNRGVDLLAERRFAAAAATLIEAAGEPSLGGFVLGTDGSGADTLMVTEGGVRPAADALKPRKRKRWPSALVMDGPEIVKFTLEVVPAMIERVLDQSKWTRDDVEFYLMHQATFFMLDHLRERLNVADEQIPLAMQEYGNTVSSTLPLLMHDLRAAGRLRPGTQTLLIGFGVGLSWAGCSFTESWQPRDSSSAATAAQQGGIEQHSATCGKAHLDAGPNGKPAADAAKAVEGT